MNKLNTITFGENSFNHTNSISISNNSLNSNQLQSIDFSSFTNLQHVVIQSNSLQYITTISFEGLNHLQSIIIQPYSLNYVNNFIISNPSIIQWKQIIHTIPSLLECHPYITNLTIPNDSCNENNYTSIYFQSFPYIVEIIIGKRSLTNITMLSISGLIDLVYFSVDENSLTSLTIFDANNLNPNLAFSIDESSMRHIIYRYICLLYFSLNCSEITDISQFQSLSFFVKTISVISNTCNTVSPTSLALIAFQGLTHITIGNSALKYIQQFTISTLPSLQVIQIGRCSLSTQCEGIPPTPSIIFNTYILNCPNLKTISIEEYSFSQYALLNFNNLPSLEELVIGKYSFYYIVSFLVKGINVIEYLIDGW